MEEAKINAGAAAPKIEGIEILELLGSGGMSLVYKAKQLKLERIVAVKVLSERALLGGEEIKRFQNEARLSSALQHPNICKTFAFGLAEENQPFIVMEYLEGLSLAERLKGEPLGLQKFKEIFLSLLSALETAHKTGLLHRDIKPANIMLCDASKNDAEVKLLDFGIAKNVFDGQQAIQNLTQSGVVLGTPVYMSPEQCLGKKLDARSDLYSLACVMYETLIGKPPFAGDSTLQLMQNHCGQALPSRKTLAAESGLPSSLLAVVLSGLEKEPNARPSSAAEFSSRLENALKTIDPERFRRKSQPQRKAILIGVLAFMVLSTVALLVFLKQAGNLRFDSSRQGKNADLVPSRLASISYLAQRGEAAIANNKFDEAESLLLQCVRKIEARPNYDPIFEITELHLLIKCLFLEQKYKEAFQYAKIALNKCERIRTKNRHELLSKSLQIAAVAESHLSEPNNAIADFTRGLDETSIAFGAISPETLFINKSFADYYFLAGKPGLALPLYERTLVISKTLGTPKVIYPALVALGDCNSKLENYAQAIKYFEEAVKIKIDKNTQNAEDVLLTSCKLAYCYMKMNNLKAASSTYELGLAAVKDFKTDELERIAALRGLSDCYVRMGNYRASLPVFERLVAYDEKNNQVNPAIAAADLINLGVGRQQNKQWAQAAALYMKALAIKEKAYGPESVDVETLREYLANAYLKQDKFASAEPVLEQSVAWWRESPNRKQTFPFEFSVTSLIQCYQHSGKRAKVIPLQKLLQEIKSEKS